MRIKKFTCINCGAPKVNDYKSPYIMCDYCGSFTDIDYTLGFDVWNEDPIKTEKYKAYKIQYMTNSKNALQRGAKEEYYNLQHAFWDYYYTTYPAYLPPSIDTPDKYKLYLDVCALSSTNSGFDLITKQKQTTLNAYQQLLKYYQVNGSTKVESEGFFKMAEYFIELTRDGFKDFYDNPDYSILNEFLPKPVHMKMKLSSFVQVWMPYLIESDAHKLLKMTGFSLEYVEINQPPGRKGECEYCKAEIYFPDGSYKVYCEKCRKTTKVQAIFKCLSCGAENSVPDNPSKPVICEFCGVENRLIKALFG